MILSGCISTTKPIITCASLSNNSSNPRTTNNSSKIATPKPTNIKPKQPSIAEIEQAIGAGKFRDYDPASDQGETKSFFDLALSKSIGKTEGSTEQKLRETGEWINEQAESAARSSSKRILVAMFFWIAPAWFLLFLVATGAVKLPFSFPALDDLIM